VGCSGAHGGAALGHLITSRSLVSVTADDLSAPFCLSQSPLLRPYLSAIDRSIDPIRASAPPKWHVCRENLDRRQCGASFDKKTRSEGPLMAQSGRFASEPKAVALDCALRFESPPNSRAVMVCLCRASCFYRLLSSYRCCRSSRRLRRLIKVRRHAGTATASCRAIISHRITAFQLTPRKIRFCGRRVATGAPGISIQPQVTSDTTATGTISASLGSTVVTTMAAASALVGRGRRSGRSGIVAEQALVFWPRSGGVPWVQPWGTAAAKALLAMPKNASTDRQYSGINVRFFGVL
jgi:hypothetical protein